RVGMTVKYAENGREGLEVLHRNPDVSLVLMDGGAVVAVPGGDYRPSSTSNSPASRIALTDVR
ncbi:hypothetical protein, partial [Streptomyces rubiginosohelvolus]